MAKYLQRASIFIIFALVLTQNAFAGLVALSINNLSSPIYNNRTYNNVQLVATNQNSASVYINSLNNINYPENFTPTNGMNTCAKILLAPGQSCTITGTFFVAKPGTYTLTWSAGLAAENYVWPTVSSSTSITALSGQVGLSIDSTNSLNKVIAYTGQTGTGTITVTNGGTSDAIGLTATISGAANATIAPGTCTSVLTVGSSCTFMVSYAPTTTSTGGFSNQTANVNVTYSDTLGVEQTAYTINLAQVNPGQFISLPNYAANSLGLPSATVNSITEFNGVLYAGTDSGLAISTDQGAHWQIKTMLDGLGSNYINQVFVDSKGTIYVGTTANFQGYAPTEMGGLAISTNGGASFTNYTTANGLASNTVQSVYADGTGNVYAGTYGSGLSVSTNSGASFGTTYTVSNSGLASNYVGSIYVANGTIYAATGSGAIPLTPIASGGVSILPAGQSTFINYLTGQSVSAVYVANNTIYAATFGNRGAGVYTSSISNPSFTPATGAPDFCTSIYAVGTTVYVGCRTGLGVSVNNGSIFTTTYTANNGLGGGGSSSVHGVFAGSDGTIYAATSLGQNAAGFKVGGGLSILSPAAASFSTFPTIGLGRIYTYSIYAAGNNIYVGSNAGVAMSTDGGQSFTTASLNGLRSPTILSIYGVGNTIYAGTVNTGNNALGGLSVSADGGASFTTYTASNNGLGSNSIFGLYVVGNTVYAAAVNDAVENPGGVSVSTNGGLNFTTYTSTSGGLLSSRVYGVYATGGAGSPLYVATRLGLNVSTTGAPPFTAYTTTSGSGLTSNVINDVKVAANGMIYLGTSLGISIMAPGQTTFTNYPTGFNSTSVSKIFLSSDGSMLYAASRADTGGLSVSPTSSIAFTNYTISNGLPNNNVYMVVAVGSNVYVATQSGLAMAQIPLPSSSSK